VRVAAGFELFMDDAAVALLFGCDLARVGAETTSSLLSSSSRSVRSLSSSRAASSLIAFEAAVADARLLLRRVGPLCCSCFGFLLIRLRFDGDGEGERDPSSSSVSSRG
jgi:hypothetical protein